MATRARTFTGGLTRKLLIGFGGLMAVMVVVAGLVIAFLSSHSQSLETVLRENYDSVVYCDRMMGALDQAQMQAQANLTAGSSGGSAQGAQKVFEENALKQLRNTTLPGELEKSQAAIDAGRRVFAKIAEMGASPSPAARLAIYQNDVFPQYQESRKRLGEVSEMNLANLAKVNRQVRSSLLEMRSLMMALLLAGLALSVVCVYFTARAIIRPLMHLTASVRQVEGGKLDLLVDVDSTDEIGELAQAFNEMTVKLREYRQLEKQRLVRTEQTTQSAIDSLPDAVALLDVDGKIELANRTAQVHFKLEPGANIHAIRPDWAATFLQPVLQTGRAVAPDGYRSAIQLFDESGERFLLPRAMPVTDALGATIGVTLVLVEVTHLRKADEFKSGLLSTVSHELKTPLTSIRMAVRMLLDKRIGDINDRQQTLLAAARQDSERLVRTVEDILTIGRVEAGRTRLELADASVAEIVQRALATAESTAAERRISFVQHAPQSSPRVRVDLNLASCALSNVLSNAVKFSPPGSTVTIHVTLTDRAVEVAVQDEGPGIAEEFRSRVFEKFFRIPTPDGPPGAGLGLSIAAEIMHLHGGTIEVRTDAERGGRFVLHFPHHESASPSNSPALFATGHSGSNP